MSLVRRHDWRSRLSAVIEEALQRPFEWGHHDCALFAADAVLAMTDRDLAEGLRGEYANDRQALKLLTCRDFDPEDHARALLPAIHPALAQVGDVAILPPEGPWYGIFTGAAIAVVAPAGLAFLPRAAAIRALHVPFAGEAD